MGSQGYVMVTSAGFCKTGSLRKWEQWNWFVLGDCRGCMGGESFPLPVWRSVGGGFTDKEEFDAWVVRAVT